jgi:hypothetical protein
MSAQSTIEQFDFSPLKPAAAQVAAISGCTPDEALREFTRFFQVKVEAKDVDAELLSPTGLMDHIWHAAVLDTRLYESLQQHVGMKIHHNPGGANRTPEETRKRNARLDRMVAAYKERFGSTPIGLRPHDEIKDAEMEEEEGDEHRAKPGDKPRC